MLLFNEFTMQIEYLISSKWENWSKLLELFYKIEDIWKFWIGLIYEYEIKHALKLWHFMKHFYTEWNLFIEANPPGFYTPLQISCRCEVLQLSFQLLQKCILRSSQSRRNQGCWEREITNPIKASIFLYKSIDWFLYDNNMNFQ